MSEYWKSLPRKFCDMCKCWFADNKASIEFHERGKRHQENAAKRIQEIQKRGIKEAKKQQKLEDDMDRIEKAALAAYKKDLQNEAVSGLEANNLEKVQEDIQKLQEKMSEAAKSRPIVQPSKKKKNKLNKKGKDHFKVYSKKWYEGITEEGHKYYWNTETSESQWDPPQEGYFTLEEQSKASSQSIEETTETQSNGKDVETVEPKCAVFPQPKIDPYGQWTTIEQKEPEEIDLQLPKPSEDIVEVFIPIVSDAPKLKIKEKVIGALSDVDSIEEVTFKKRKFLGSSKRYTRQRTDDD